MSYVAPTVEHIVSVCTKLDDIDLEEIECSTGLFPLEALIDSAEQSMPCYIVMDNKKPIGIFGVFESPVDPEVAFPWGFFAPELREMPMWLLRDSLDFINGLSDLFDDQIVYVLNNNERSIRYLEWLGFEATGEVFPGLHGSLFKEYVLCATQL